MAEQIIPKYERDIPTYLELQQMNPEDKMSIFFDIFGIDKGFVKNCIDPFPNSWKILIVAMKYVTPEADLKKPFIYSLILTKIILSCIDKKVGRIRSPQYLNQRAADVDESCRKRQQKMSQNVSQAIEEINEADCYQALQKLLPYFVISTEMKVYTRLFDRNLVHVMSQFQSCLMHINILCELFDLPFEKCFIWECYDGTLIYNLLTGIHKRNLDFVTNLLELSPTVLHCFNVIANQFESKM